MFKPLALAAAITLLATSAHAEVTNASIGAGVVVAPRYAGSKALETQGFPLVNLTYQIDPEQSLYLQGIGAGYAYQVDEKLRVALHAQYRGERSTTDTQELYGLPQIDATAEIGPRVSYQLNKNLSLVGQMLWDAGDAYNGYTGRIGATYAQPLSEKLQLAIGTGLNYGSEKFTQTYFGVTSAQATPARRAYTPDAGITHADAAASLTYSLTKNWALNGTLGADYLLGDVADSPITQTELQPRAMLGVIYRF